MKPVHRNSHPGVLNLLVQSTRSCRWKIATASGIMHNLAMIGRCAMPAYLIAPHRLAGKLNCPTARSLNRASRQGHSCSDRSPTQG